MTKHFHFSSADVDRFTCGDCHILARAINKLTGWPIHVFCDEPQDGPVQHWMWPNAQDHAFVITPDGQPLDIEGLHDDEAFISKWSSTGYHHEIEWDHLRTQWGKCHFGDYSYSRAKKLAAEIVEGVMPHVVQ